MGAALCGEGRTGFFRTRFVLCCHDLRHHHHLRPVRAWQQSHPGARRWGNRGRPTNPAWYHNLIAHRDVTVEIGIEKFAATAIALDDVEAARLGRIQIQRLPGLAETMSKITRKVPAVLLEPKK